jgi:hypothetical protein
MNSIDHLAKFVSKLTQIEEVCILSTKPILAFVNVGDQAVSIGLMRASWRDTGDGMREFNGTAPGGSRHLRLFGRRAI